MSTWRELDTRRGRLIEMQAALKCAQGTCDAVLEDASKGWRATHSVGKARMALAEAVALFEPLINDA